MNAADEHLETLMFEEARSASHVVARQVTANDSDIAALGAAVRDLSPHVVLTCARGSSDHAATYAKYLIETYVGVPVASFAPSISSVYAVRQSMNGALFVAISQSGKSPDLVASAEAAKEAGAMVIAFVNVEDSPLAHLADAVVPLSAGPEFSVAATKSYIATLAALVHFVAAWSGDDGLAAALRQLPSQLKDAWAQDWSGAVDVLREATNFFVIGRGLGLGIAQEAALKFKETSGLHAEAYSAAEVRHGPMAIVNEGFPVLVFTQDDGTRPGCDDVVADFAARGARVMAAGNSYDGATNLGCIDGAAAATAPILFIQSFYRMVNMLAVTRGHDPDRPPHLRKVTETV